MTPDEFARRMRAYRERVTELPAQRVEATIRSSVAHGVPPGVSVVAGRTSAGTQVRISGPGARRFARSLARRLRPEAAAAVREAVR
jgi:hypothetical protein